MSSIGQSITGAKFYEVDDVGVDKSFMPCILLKIFPPSGLIRRKLILIAWRYS